MDFKDQICSADQTLEVISLGGDISKASIVARVAKYNSTILSYQSSSAEKKNYKSSSIDICPLFTAQDLLDIINSLIEKEDIHYSFTIDGNWDFEYKEESICVGCPSFIIALIELIKYLKVEKEVANEYISEN